MVDNYMDKVKEKALEALKEFDKSDFYKKHSWMMDDNSTDEYDTLYVNLTPTEVYDFDSNSPMSEAQWDAEYQEKFKTRK